jgi:chromosome segregation ATPase
VAEAAAQPALAGNQYSEAQHFSLLKSAVEQETSSLTAEKADLENRITALESEKAALATELSETAKRIDLLEADKVTAEAAAEKARTELDEFKAEIARKEQIAELKNVRKNKVQTANANLAEDFFTDERVTRWAQMAEEDFESFVADMTEMANAIKPAEKAGDKPAEKAVTTTEAARETAAFTGGTTPTASEGKTNLALLLGAERRDAIA